MARASDSIGGGKVPMANRLMHHLVVDELMLIPVKQDTNCDCLTNRSQRVFKFRNNVLELSSWNILMMEKRRSLFPSAKGFDKRT